MFLTISSDTVHIYHQSFGSTSIPFDDIERVLPQKLVQIVRKYDISDIYVLNGPGSYTIMRVGCLTCNLLHDTMGVRLHDIPKLSLYKAGVDSGVLPHTGVLFMGQRKNMWLVRRTPAGAEDREISKISAESIVDALEGEYWVDLVTDHPVFHSLDLTYMVSDMSISDDGETLTYMYVDQYISVPLSDISTHVDQIVPRYMAEAV